MTSRLSTDPNSLASRISDALHATAPMRETLLRQYIGQLHHAPSAAKLSDKTQRELAHGFDEGMRAIVGRLVSLGFPIGARPAAVVHELTAAFLSSLDALVACVPESVPESNRHASAARWKAGLDAVFTQRWERVTTARRAASAIFGEPPAVADTEPPPPGVDTRPGGSHCHDCGRPFSEHETIPNTDPCFRKHCPEALARHRREAAARSAGLHDDEEGTR